MNEVTGGDLAYLRKLADEHVPAIATRLGDARLKVVALLAAGDETFAHDDEVGHDNEPAVPWECLRDTISRILLVNESRLWSVRGAVNQAIGDFGDTDRAHANGIATAANLNLDFAQQDAGIGSPDPVAIPDPRLTDLSLGDTFDDVAYRPE